MKIKCSLLLVVLTYVWAFSQSMNHSEARSVAIQFVGCKSDGQVGPMDAPIKNEAVIDISAAAGEHLAYYKARSGPGVLAPREWFCFGTYGSSGETLYVSPSPLKTSDLFATNWNGFVGPAIEISRYYGGTSGRFTVATVIARVFPAHRDFVRKTIAENAAGDASPISFIFGPYDKDILRYRSKNVVEFQTPANMEGLGTHSHLRKNGDAISGVAILIGPEPYLITLSARLPADKDHLTKSIIEQAEQEATTSPP